VDHDAAAQPWCGTAVAVVAALRDRPQVHACLGGYPYYFLHVGRTGGGDNGGRLVFGPRRVGVGVPELAKPVRVCTDVGGAERGGELVEGDGKALTRRRGRTRGLGIRHGVRLSVGVVPAEEPRA